MSTFANAVQNQTTRTTNGMKAFNTTAKACVDLFYKIGASRGKNIVPDFVAAYAEDRELALRIAAWARDVRGGAGERQIFRDVVKYLETANATDAKRLIAKTPVWGRWDDVLVASSGDVRDFAFSMIKRALESGDGLCAKWMPRKSPVATQLRQAFGWTPKFYRKTLVGLTKVVETQMCARDWDNINFSHVPSLASARYKKAFDRNTGKYAEYVQALVKGVEGVKVNAGAVYPYDVIKGLNTCSETQTDLAIKQWEALENFIGDAPVLPMVDVSGSMGCPVGGGASLTCMDVAVSLGLYCADKNKGSFKDLFLTFTSVPKLQKLQGNVVQKLAQLQRAEWGMSTDIVAALKLIVQTAVSNNVPQAEMPSMLLVMSDMQFNQCARFDGTMLQHAQQLFAHAGYQLPKIVFWNLNAYDNVPVKFDQQGVALVSGFSPAVMKAVLKADFDQFTPEAIMRQAVCVERYDM